MRGWRIMRADGWSSVHSPPVRARKKQANMFSLRKSSSSSRRKGGKRRAVLVGVVAGG